MASTKSLKRQRCSEEEDERVAVGSSLLEALPQEILVSPFLVSFSFFWGGVVICFV